MTWNINDKEMGMGKSLALFYVYMQNRNKRCDEMEEMQLYNAAVDSVKRYKEQGGELTDFEDFMEEIEKEYRRKIEGQG